MKLTGAEIIVKTLIEQGADTVFGYPGGTVLNIYDQLYLHKKQINHITSCHEQHACHAADGYARASGKVGVVIATSGPGATNLVTGLATANLDSTPLVAITGNVATDFIGRDSFQEVDISGVTMPITKHNFLVLEVERLADTVRKAFEIAKSGRPGAVLVDVPKDIQAAICEYTPKAEVERVCVCRYTEKELNSALTLLKSARFPFIYVGGGAVSSNASNEINELADKLDAPVGASMMGLSILSADNPRFLGMTGMHGNYAANRVKNKCDLLIAIGTRFSDRATGNKAAYQQARKIIHIDIDPAEIDKNICCTTSLLGDVKEVLQELNKNLPKTARSDWREIVKAECNHPMCNLQMDKNSLNPQTALQTIRKHAKEDAIVATDVGQHQMWTAQYFKFKSPRTFITSGGLGTMGFGLGAAIGACVSANNRQTVLVTSDGSFHMNMNECATVVSNNLPLTIVVLNNNALGMVRQWQRLFFGERFSNTSLNRKTDYVKLAEAFGMQGARVKTLAELDDAVKASLALNAPSLIEVVIDEDEKVLPMIPPNCTINDIILK
jgi:acetolactate synthase-1/2/3 large subunit